MLTCNHGSGQDKIMIIMRLGDYLPFDYDQLKNIDC